VRLVISERIYRKINLVTAVKTRIRKR